VVGESSLSGGATHAFLYSGGSMSDLGTLDGAGVNSAATAINNAGQVAGYSQTSGGSPNFAFLYSGGSMSYIGSLGGYSNAYAMNEVPQIVGHSSGQAFIYSGGVMSPIPDGVNALGINEGDQAVGYTFGGHAFLYSGDTTTDLGTLGGAFTVGRGINDLGHIVGDNGGAPGSHAFLYSGGVMQDLNSLVGPGYEIYAAFGINNAGQIAAYGIDMATAQPQGLLLSPVTAVAVNIRPESVNVDSSGTLTVLIYGAVDFDASQIDVGSVQFAGATAWQSTLVDSNNDGLLDLQLKFRTQDTTLQQIYAQLLVDDLDADGVLDSTRQTAEIAVTGQTLDDELFSGSDSITLFLAGRSLRELLDSLFG
jgi:probable HAF family extracellular repeat protein